MKRFISTTILIATVSLSCACGDDKQVLAEVNGKAITQAEFDAYLALKHIPAEDQKRRDRALKEYLEREGLAEVIAKEGKLDAVAIEAEVDEFRKEMLISRYFDKFLTDQVSEESVQNLYGTDAAKYETKKVHAAHILFRTNKRMSEEQRKAILTTAQEVHSKVQSGEAFEELAKQFSEDKISGSRGGDLGWIKEGTIDERFSKRAFELKAGTVTEPFETRFGFHILKVIEEPKTIRRPLGAVAGEIRYRLRNEAKEKELKRLEAAVKVSKKKSYDPKLTPKPDPKKAPPDPAKSGLADPSMARPDDGGLGAPAPTPAPAPDDAPAASPSPAVPPTVSPTPEPAAPKPIAPPKAPATTPKPAVPAAPVAPAPAPTAPPVPTP